MSVVSVEGQCIKVLPLDDTPTFETGILLETTMSLRIFLSTAVLLLDFITRETFILLTLDASDHCPWVVKVLPDATYASLCDGSSQGAFIVLVLGADGLIAPILWQSKKLERVTKSPLASEASAVGEAADAALFVSSMLCDILKESDMRTVHCYTDNKSLVDTIKSTKMHNDRKLRVDLSRLREMIGRKEMTLSWVDGKHQLADCLTKRGASSDLLFETLKCSKILGHH